MRTPPAGASGGAQAGDPAQAGSRPRAGAGGAITSAPAVRGSAANNAQIAALLEGHQFAVRLKVSQVY
jgi:hypothetical protein